MRGFEIIGTGHYVPGPPIPNASLARVMDTSDEWITQRSGIRQRHFAPDGVGASDLAAQAAEQAIAAAGIARQEIDYIVFATMTPDYVFPGSGALLGAKLGLVGVPALDIRQQCAAMLFGLQLIDGLIQSGAAKTVLFVGAEAHAGTGKPPSGARGPIWGALQVCRDPAARSRPGALQGNRHAARVARLGACASGQ
jgi:3-oxoacyl-[acyl-carrier-protein] synthase-3